MNYGTTAYGSSAIGGSGNNLWQTFLSFLVYLEGSYESEAEVNTDDPLYSVFARKTSDAETLTVRVLTRNDLAETPQLQTTGGLGISAQLVVGSARFIKVEADVADPGALLEVLGRPGD